MRRSSNAVLQTQTSEPVIVVEESNIEDFEEKKPNDSESHNSSEDESPILNPYLLSPYARDIRKHSLPTPQCSGITASQVRRLSERGETVGPGPRQTEFLATLSTAPAPSPGGRRHSVVTISKVPSTLFGRNRRESVAAFPSPVGFPRVLPNRRESIACPPSTEPRGSVHNLQLDIMDDIVQARKVRMKLFSTSNERVCEVQPLDDSSSVQRYTNTASRRYSDFVGTTLAPIPSSTKRRASEMPPPNTCATTSASKLTSTGIVCSNTDLISILSSLSTSSMEINQCEAPKIESNKTTKEKRSRLKSNRSNSFDISILHSTVEPKPTESHSPSNWFAKRHQPSSTTLSQERNVIATEPGKVIWDGRSGSIVDPQALGSAIEVFLRQTTPDPDSSPQSPPIQTKTSSSTTNKSAAGRAKAGWFSHKSDSDSTETCDTSICSTLKDLFVK